MFDNGVVSKTLFFPGYAFMGFSIIQLWGDQGLRLKPHQFLIELYSSIVRCLWISLKLFEYILGIIWDPPFKVSRSHTIFWNPL